MPQLNFKEWENKCIALSREIYIHNRITPKAAMLYAKSWMEEVYGPCPDDPYREDRTDHNPYPHE